MRLRALMAAWLSLALVFSPTLAIAQGGELLGDELLGDELPEAGLPEDDLQLLSQEPADSPYVELQETEELSLPSEDVAENPGLPELPEDEVEAQSDEPAEPAQLDPSSQAAQPNQPSEPAPSAKGLTAATGDYDDVFRVRGVADYDKAKQVLAQVNAERRAQGLGSIKMDKELERVAMQRAAECAIIFSHTRPNGRSCFEISDAVEAENIAGGASTAASAMNLWMNSAGHRANILDSYWNSMGAGCVTVDGMTFWVQVFSSQSGSGTYVATGTKTQVFAMDVDYANIPLGNSGFNLYDPPDGTQRIRSGKTYKLTVYVPNPGFSYAAPLHPSTLAWKSTNTDIATVSSAGVVTAGTKEGSCTISATSPGGHVWKQRIRVVVSPPDVQYQTHVQKVGWQGWKKNGQTSGTSGRGLRLEGIRIKLANKPVTGGIQYRTHVQKIGWQGWKSDGTMSGTSGRSLRLEAIQIKLTGELAEKYDVYYRVHAQHFGWMGWAKNGGRAGTAGYAYRLEAIQIKVVRKGAAAPGSTSGAFRQK